MKTRKFLFCVMAMAAVALLLRLPVTAAAQDDPPGRVARINFLQGNVSFQPSGGTDDDWVAAELNRPVTIGDRVWVDSEGLAEMHIGSTAIRMDRNTGMSFLNLSDNVVQLQLSAGSIYVHLRRLDSDDAFEVDTPNLAFSLLQPGTYRIDVDADNHVTVVTVREGQGEVTGGGRSWNIISDQLATFTGTDYLSYSLEDADSLPQSDFDNWSFARDRLEDRVASVQYVSPDVTGYEDLDANGSWDNEDGYGPMWFPVNVVAGWAPYRFGHWVYILPWGWSWVDSAPWGFAPFHYGRWAFVRGRWGWAPGPLVAGERCVYAPALVAWVGGGPGFGASVSFGNAGGVAWFPLGPREVYSPWYRVSDEYVTRVNITNTYVERTTIINVYHSRDDRGDRYMNERVGGAITLVDHDTFVNGREVDRHQGRVSQRDIANAPVYHDGPQVQPEHGSMVGDARHSDRRPPREVEDRQVVARRAPPSPTYVRQENNYDNRGENPGGTRGGGQPYNGNGGNNPNGERGGYNNSGGNNNPPRGGNNSPVNNPNGNRGSGYNGGNPNNGGGNNNPPPAGSADNNPNGDRGRNRNEGGNNNPPPAGNADNNPGGGRGSNNNAGGNNNPPPAGNNNPPSAGNAGNNPNGGRGPNNNAGGNNNPPPAGNGGNNPNGDRGRNGNAGGNYNPPPQPAGNNGNNPNGQGGNYRGRGDNNPPSNQQGGGNSNPNAGAQPNFRPAPPVRQPTPEEQQNDNNRQQQWQQRHQEVHGNPPPAPPPPPANPPAANTPPPKNNSNNGNNGNGQGNQGGNNHQKPPHR